MLCAGVRDVRGVEMASLLAFYVYFNSLSSLPPTLLHNPFHSSSCLKKVKVKIQQTLDDAIEVCVCVCV